ncbi:MAG: MATE family efflux transporter, partial [Bacilli bacterium]|nr:MATE family efflux transporter [Bacilli bacterium]
ILLLPIAFGLYGVEVTQAAADILTFIVTVPIQIIFFKKILPLKKEEEAKTE